MKHPSPVRARLATALAVTLPIMIAACSTVEPDPEQKPTPTNQSTPRFRVAARTYNAARGGLQITGIYFDQDSNKALIGLEDEWIVLQTDRPMSTSGWTLNAGDVGQDYPLPDSITSKLTIYTKAGPTNPEGQVIALHLGRWIWNNIEPDVAWVYNDNHQIVDSMTYVGN